MYLVLVALSRAVPLLFGVSAALVLGRLAYDRVPARPPLRRAGFAFVTGGLLLALFPFAARGVSLVGAEAAYFRRDWPSASRRFAAASRPGHALGGTPGTHWAFSLMNEHRWNDAERVLLLGIPRPSKGSAITVSPDRIFWLGVCRYYQGRFGPARAAIEASGGDGFPYIASYLLGRLAERRGDLATAAARYEAALSIEKAFYPALYHLARRRLASGDVAGARALAAGTGVDAPLAEALRDGRVPPDREFVIVQRPN